MKCLIVEDCEMNAHIISLFIKKYSQDIRLEFAVNGQIAIEKAQEHDFDFILMDINMPIMDGITATRCIQKNGFKKPIIAITALETDYLSERNALSIYDHILTKPIHLKLFFRTLDSVLTKEPRTLNVKI